MSTVRSEKTRLDPRPLPDNIRSVQPGGGAIMALELLWGRWRRWYLHKWRAAYVQKMRMRRIGECPHCAHNVVDSRDLKYFENVCGFRFEESEDPFRWRNQLGLARIGLAEIVVCSGVLAAIATICLVYLSYATVIPVALLLFVLAFFRDPVRVPGKDPWSLVAPADGTVDDIEELSYCEPIGGPAVKVGIFLSVFNVHINRVPETGRVIELKYFPGKFGNALNRSSAEENEQLWMLLETEKPPHRRILVKQIAGAIARRIVCVVRPGQSIVRGQRFGMIKFGSRTEMYLPKEGGLCLEVRRSQKVRGGTTVVARYVGLEKTI